MKNKILTILTLAFLSNANAQAPEQRFQFGIGMGGATSFISPETKIFEKNGVGGTFTMGLNLNYNFSNAIGIFTGIEFDLEKYSYKNVGSLNYYYEDTEIFRKKDLNGGANEVLYSFTERQYAPKYLTIPTMFLFKTNKIGYLKYFGKFGLRNSIRIGNKMNDNGSNIDPLTLVQTSSENNNMKVSSDLARYKGSIGLAAGVEWNFSGNTVLTAELGYYYGISNLHSQNSLTGDEDKNRHLFTYTNPADLTSAKEYKTYSAKQDMLQLKVSILF